MLDSLSICVVFWGGVYGLHRIKMANSGLRTYSNTLLVIPGTSKVFPKSGPFRSLVITEKPFKAQGETQTIFEKIFVLAYLRTVDLHFWEFVQKMGTEK